MSDLHPPQQPFATHSLQVDALHTLHVEQCGNPRGQPVLCLHGGPGAGFEPYQRQFFDPRHYHSVLFDQRGCGRSTPHAELHNNTTWDLVADIEAIRQHLGIERWVVFGGSWGSTLALAYAETHPQRVSALVLRGVFLCRRRDIRWFYQDGADRLLPEAWAEFIAPIDPAERGDMIAAYHAGLTGADEVQRLRLARAWALWEASAMTLQPSEAIREAFGETRRALALASIEAHYFKHDAFLQPDQLLRDAASLEAVPGHIVHGRYDLLCPVEQALALKSVWPAAQLQIVPEAGHAATEPGIRSALVRVMDSLVESS